MIKCCAGTNQACSKHTNLVLVLKVSNPVHPTLEQFGFMNIYRCIFPLSSRDPSPKEIQSSPSCCPPKLAFINPSWHVFTLTKSWLKTVIMCKAPSCIHFHFPLEVPPNLPSEFSPISWKRLLLEPSISVININFPKFNSSQAPPLDSDWPPIYSEALQLLKNFLDHSSPPHA